MKWLRSLSPNWLIVPFLLISVASWSYAGEWDMPGQAVQVIAKRLLPPNIQTANYTLQPSDCFRPFVQSGSGSSGFISVTLPAAVNFPSWCVITVKNGDTGRAKSLSGFPSDIAGTNLYPTMAVEVAASNSAWQTIRYPQRWRLNSSVTLYVRPDGSDSNDGLANSSGGALLTPNQAATITSAAIDINTSGGGSITWQHTCSSPPCSITANAQLLKIVGVKFVGGIPAYQGDCTTPTNMKLNPGSAQQADIQSTFSDMINVCGFELAGGANLQDGIYVSGGGTKLEITGPMQCDAMSASGTIGAPSGNCFFAHSHADIYSAASTLAISGNMGSIWAVTDGGYFENAAALTVSGTGACGSACAYVELGGAMFMPSLTNSSSVTGTGAQVGFGGEINTGGATNACSTSVAAYWPGNAHITLSDTAGNRGNCF